MCHSIKNNETDWEVKMKIYSAKQAAEAFGVSFRTIKRWIYTNKIKTFLTPTGQHKIYETEIQRLKGEQNQNTNKVVTYARVSTQKQKEDLERQSERLKQYCLKHNYQITQEIKDIASGLNDNRKGLQKIYQQINQQNIGKIVIEHRDRLTRFGYNYLENYFKSHEVEIIIIEQKEIKEDIIKDLIDIMTSFCAKLYGRRGNKNKTKQTINKYIETIKQ